METFSPAEVWPDGGWVNRNKIINLDSAVAVDTNGMDVVGYADDTTIVGRLSTIDVKRHHATTGYHEWGHAVHPDKWQRLWSGPTVPPPTTVKDGIHMDSKVLGCHLEADGGYARELKTASLVPG